MTTSCPCPPTAERFMSPEPPAGRRASWPVIAAQVVLGLGLLAAGCSDHQKRQWRYRSPEQNFHDALHAPHADDRREAVARIAESRYVRSEEAFVVLDAAARHDPAPQVRCVALRALAGYADDRPVATLLDVLRATGESAGGQSPPDDTTIPARPPDDDVRWETVRAVTALGRAGVLTGRQPELTRDILVRLAESDLSRHVRIAAIEALGQFQDRRVLVSLIRCLRTEDFGVAERAERSLIQLTGTTHSCDADAWEDWLAATEHPFARAGQVPASTRPAGPSWWDHTKRCWRRAIKLQND